MDSGPEQAATPAADYDTGRDPQSKALAQAKRTGKKVEVTSLRGESSEVFATPEGVFEAREYLRPVRTRVSGKWRQVDTQLVRTKSGVVVPKSATVGLKFSGGGDGPLVRMERTGRELLMSWPLGKLPRPELEEDTAVYRDILPAVDLRLTAQPDGFSQLLVVKSAEAAASEELSRLELDLDTQGMKVRERKEGGLEAVDNGAGTPVFTASEPLMWDSSPGGSPGGPTPMSASVPATEADRGGDGDNREPGPAESGKLAPVGVEVSEQGRQLVLKPEADVLRGKDTQYPVFIDPQWHSPRASAWTMVSKYWSSSPQWKFNGKPDAGMGYCGWAYCKPHDTKRLFYRIPVSRFAGKSILSAEFVVRNVHSASCKKRGVQLWRTKGISSGTTWNSQQSSGFWKEKLSSRSFAYGYEGCARKDAEFSVKAAVQKAADARSSTMTFGLRASDESDRYGWKRFSDKAHLRVEYNRPPAQVRMSQLAMEYGGVCKRPGEKARVRSLGKLYARGIKDPDEDHVSVQFQAKWDSGDGKGLIARWKPARTSYKKSGSDFAVSLPSSVPKNTTVHWYVRVYDGAQYSSWSWAGSPTGCYFVYDTKVPEAPTINSGEYPRSDPSDPKDPWYDGVGRYGYFQLDSRSGDVTSYRWGLNSDPRKSNALSTSGGEGRKASVLPGRPGLNFVTAQAFDGAGNASEIRTYPFRVKAGQPERATWQFDEKAGSQSAKGSTPPRTAELHGGVTPGADGAKGTAVSFNGTDGYAATDLPVVNTRRGFTVSTWVKLDELPGHAAVVAAQPGNHSPGFELYYSAAYDRWVFNQYASDEPDAKIVRAMADVPGDAEAGAWTHLVGSYDGVEKQLQLFVNGKLVGKTDHPSAWEARRGLTIGAGSYDGSPDSFFPGTIDDLQILDKRIAQDEVDKLYTKEPVGDPGRPAIAVFPMDEEAGATELVAHGDVLPAVFHGGVTSGQAGVAGKAAEFDGKSGYARIGEASGPHVNSFRSFTVSAWARLDKKPDHAAIITAQAGRNRPGFELYYSSHYGRWAFNQYEADSVEASPVRAMQPDGSTARAGEWVHLIGVHDTVADLLTLYVNGEKVGETRLGGAFYADQSMLIGAGSYSGGSVTNHFPGRIDDVRLFDRPVSASEAQQLFQQRPVLAGRWQLDESSAPEQPADTVTGRTPDSGPSGMEALLHSGAQLDPAAAFMGEQGLLLDGEDDHVTTTGMPVNTDESFTVTAWVQAAAPADRTSVAMSAPGRNQSAFAVGFVPDGNDPGGPGRWQLVVPDADSSTPSLARADNALGFYDAREWNHLAVVYDGFAKRAKLYVNGTLQDIACADGDGDGGADDSACQDAIPWADDALSFHSDGPLEIGRGKGSGEWRQYWPGAIDDVWAFRGALSDEQVAYLAQQWFDVPTEVPDTA
ncbi:LamG domain-containing protein [Streptomyces sp. 891-h]|nr:LamG domain-containing protein [Streptomyces sp. 891-h]